MITRVSEADQASVLETFRAHMTYSELSDQILLELAELVERQYVKKGEFIFHQGDPSVHMHMVERGRVVVSKGAPSGGSIISYIATRGASLNAITCFKGQPRFFLAQAMEDTILLRTTCRDFVHWVSRNPEVAINVLATMGDLLGGAFNRISDLAHENVEQRVLNALAMLASRLGSDLEITNTELAEMTGTSRESAVRVISDLQRKGLIKKERGRVKIMNVSELAKLSSGQLFII